MTQTVLILGATGKFGSAAATAFRDAGWQVRCHDRATGSLTEDARGVDVVVNGWNPPDYSKWAEQLQPMTQAAIAAARVSGATLIAPGNVYVYGAEMPRVLGPDTPHMATNPLGLLRIQAEAAYRAAGVQTILLRAGDFIGIDTKGTLFDAVIARNARKGRMTWPGDTELEHAFAWLPDMARIAVALAERRAALGAFTEVGLPGPALTGQQMAMTLTGQQMAEALSRVTGRRMKITRFNWALLRLAQPFFAPAAGLREMRHLWQRPHRIDGATLDRLLPEFRPTPLDQALALALNLEVQPDQPVARGRRPALAQ